MQNDHTDLYAYTINLISNNSKLENMIGAIPNLKKNVIVDYSLEKIKEAVRFIRDIDKNYTLSSYNVVFNQYTYQTTEFLSLGVFIDINLSAIGETKTEVTIEIKRKIGAFDKSYEVTLANEHIQKIISYISQALLFTDNQKATINEKYKPKEASIDKLPETTQFNCGICKKSFYANSTLMNVVFCPHCNSSNSLPRVEPPPSTAKKIQAVVVLIIIIASIYVIFFR